MWTNCTVHVTELGVRKETKALNCLTDVLQKDNVNLQTKVEYLETVVLKCIRGTGFTPSAMEIILPIHDSLKRTTKNLYELEIDRKVGLDGIKDLRHDEQDIWNESYGKEEGSKHVWDPRRTEVPMFEEIPLPEQPQKGDNRSAT